MLDLLNSVKYDDKHVSEYIERGDSYDEPTKFVLYLPVWGEIGKDY